MSDALANLVKLVVAVVVALVIVRGLSQSMTNAAAPLNGALVATR